MNPDQKRLEEWEEMIDEEEEAIGIMMEEGLTREEAEDEIETDPSIIYDLIKKK